MTAGAEIKGHEGQSQGQHDVHRALNDIPAKANLQPPHDGEGQCQVCKVPQLI